ncbi:hypothetical protein Trydic_g7857 [Trypoxylus dichotomus]
MVYHQIKSSVVYHFSLRHYATQVDKLQPPWNILFFGTDSFSLASLKVLNYKYKQKSIIVSRFANDENLKMHSWPISTVKGFHIGLVVSFGYLIPRTVIGCFPLGMLNVHASLLPRWRGAAPIIHAIANGDSKTGITIMTIKPKHFDIGNIVRQETVIMEDDILLPDLHERLANLGSKVLMEELYKLPDNVTLAKPQPNIGITLAPKVTSSFGIIDWSSISARRIYNLSRALFGLYPLITKWNDLNIKLYDIKLCSPEKTTCIQPGFVHYDRDSRLLKIQCLNSNWISVGSVGVSNKRKMSASDFNNGYLSKVDISKRIFM